MPDLGHGAQQAERAQIPQFEGRPTEGHHEVRSVMGDADHGDLGFLRLPPRLTQQVLAPATPGHPGDFPRYQRSPEVSVHQLVPHQSPRPGDSAVGETEDRGSWSPAGPLDALHRSGVHSHLPLQCSRADIDQEKVAGGSTHRQLGRWNIVIVSALPVADSLPSS